jgi:uncharacterized protein (DUF2336 family)
MAHKILSQEDVNKLLADPSAETRAETAAKIAQDFDTDRLSAEEREMAREIFRIMAKDAEVRVREALSRNLKENPAVPHEVAKALAQDVDSVALPILQFSDVLTDEDLIEIVRSQGASKQVAIAKRSTVSETVSTALVDTGDEDVVTNLVANEGAEITEQSLQKVVEDFGDNEAMQDAMVRRPRLPVTVAERLVTMVSEGLKGELVKRHELPASLATDLVLQSRERATINLSTESDEDELEQLVRQMHERGRLTPSIILRALCMGDLRFFEASVAELARAPVVNARTLIHDSGDLGLRAVFDKAGLPASQFPAVRAASDVARETEYDGGENDRERYSRRMIERILTQYGDLGVEFDSDDLEYLLTKMGQLPPDTLNAA